MTVCGSRGRSAQSSSSTSPSSLFQSTEDEKSKSASVVNPRGQCVHAQNNSTSYQTQIVPNRNGHG